MKQIIAFSLIGTTFFIYSLLCYKKRKVIYTISEPEFNVLDYRYYNLQLKVSIINSIIIASGGIISQFFQLGEIKSTILFITILIFWIINYSLRKIAVSKKYAQIVKKDELK